MVAEVFFSCLTIFLYEALSLAEELKNGKLKK